MTTRSSKGETWIPYLCILAAVALIALAVRSPSGYSGQSVSASMPPIEVTRIVTVTATFTPVLTQTPRIVMVTPTGTSTPALPFCDQVKAGNLCVQLPIPRTATAITECDAHPTYQRVCVKPASDTESEGETQ